MRQFLLYRPQQLTATELLALEAELAERITRRRFLVGAGGLAVGALTGCGAPEEQATAPTSAPTTRIVNHDLGTSEVPLSPGRIVVVDWENTLPHLLALGIKPLASVRLADYRAEKFAQLVSSLQDEAETVEALDRTAEAIPLERLTTLKPDLIIGMKWTIEPVYSELSQIAPTVPITADEISYEAIVGSLRAQAAVFALEAKAEELIARFESRLKEEARLINNPGTVSIVFPSPGDIRINSEQSLLGSLAVRLGANVTPTLEALKAVGEGTIYGPTLYEGSEELIPKLTGDTLFVLGDVADTTSVKYYEELQRKPLWNSLPAVRNGNVTLLDSWIADGNAGLPGLDDTLSLMVKAFKG